MKMHSKHPKEVSLQMSRARKKNDRQVSHYSSFQENDFLQFGEKEANLASFTSKTISLLNGTVSRRITDMACHNVTTNYSV